MKKLAYLPLFALLLAPVHNVHALMMSQEDVANQIWENYLSADSAEFKLTVTGSIEQPEFNEYASFELFVDGESGLDSHGNAVADVDAMWSATDGEERIEGRAEMIQSADRLYVRLDNGDWFFSYTDSALDAYSMQLPIASVTEDETFEELAQDITSTLEDLVDSGIVVNETLPNEVINGINSSHYGYEIDTDQVINEIAALMEVDPSETEEAKAFLREHVNVSGEIWIDPVTLYPTKFTLIVEVESEDVIVDVEVAIEFLSFNEPVNITEPSGAIDAIDYFEQEYETEISDGLTLLDPLEPVEYDDALADRLHGRILLQVDQHGEAWYVKPDDSRRYYMRDGNTAYSMMRYFGLGITDADLNQIPTVESPEEMNASTSVCNSNAIANRVKGEILLQVEQHGEAWYVDPEKCRRIYLKDGDAAYQIMRYLGLGITDADLEKLRTGYNTFSLPPTYTNLF